VAADDLSRRAPTMICSKEELGLHHGHLGLAAKTCPWTV
jgi:hypothetical protein